jgi:hypothetical protein
MAKFTFPISFESFAKTVTPEQKRLYAELDPERPLEFAYGCLAQGWKSKQYHKERQGEDQELLREIKKRMKNDPELAARLRQQDRKATS